MIPTDCSVKILKNYKNPCDFDKKIAGVSLYSSVKMPGSEAFAADVTRGRLREKLS